MKAGQQAPVFGLEQSPVIGLQSPPSHALTTLSMSLTCSQLSFAVYQVLNPVDSRVSEPKRSKMVRAMRSLSFMVPS